MHKIQTISTYMVALFNFLLIATPLFIIFSWIFIETEGFKILTEQILLRKPIVTPLGTFNLSQLNWTPLAQGVGIFADILSSLPLFLSFLLLKKLFQNYQKGEIFNLSNAKHYRHLGWLFFLEALLTKPISEGLMVTAATMTQPIGTPRYFTIGIGTPNLETIFCGILIIIISWVMIEASKLNDEQKFTI